MELIKPIEPIQPIKPPRLNSIYFYLTEGCNQRCRHCWIAPRYQGEKESFSALPVELFESIIRQAKPLGLTQLKLTGGEPLLHPKIRDLIEIVKREDLGLGMETNGVLCTLELARLMASVKNTFVSVSLDGADAETHEWVRGVKGCFEAAKDGVRNMAAAGLRPQVIMTLMRRNRGQMESLVRLAESLGAGSVKFNMVEPTGRGKKMHEAGETLTVEELVEIGCWVENVLSPSVRLQLFLSHPVAFQPLGKMFGDGQGCGVCGIFGILGVLANGSYALCGMGENVPNLVFGHAARDALAGVWYDTPALCALRQNLPKRLEGVCADCLMKATCLGTCVALNYYRSRNLLAPFWFCEIAREKGLFPESRLVPRGLEGHC